MPDVMSADQLQAIDAALPTEAEDSAEVECHSDVEKDDSSEDDSVAAPVPFTLAVKQAREAATRLALSCSFCAIQQQNWSIEPFWGCIK